MKLDKIKHITKCGHHLEIVVIGGAGAYGESILIHFPDDKWVIIDSCMSSDYSYPLPQVYLMKRGYNKVDDVTHIICTHWHLDHIEGLPALLRHYNQARFVCPFMCAEFINEIYNNLGPALTIIGKSIPKKVATIYFECLLVIAQFNMARDIIKVSDQIKSFRYKNQDYTLLALSPSNLDLMNFANSLRWNAIHNTSSSANKTSLSLLLKAHGRGMLLGGDLETNIGSFSLLTAGAAKIDRIERICNSTCGTRSKNGWCGVCDSQLIDQTKIIYIKLAHHGSDTGYCKKIFKYTNKKPIGVSTCFRQSNLPNIEVLKKISQNYADIYVTNNIEGTQNQASMSLTKQMIINASISYLCYNENVGIVTTQMLFPWLYKTQCYGKAYRLRTTHRQNKKWNIY